MVSIFLPWTPEETVNLKELKRIDRSSHRKCSVKKSVLTNFAKFTGKHLCRSLFFNKKDTLAQVFSYEFCKISKDTFFTELFWETASEYRNSNGHSNPDYTGNRTETNMNRQWKIYWLELINVADELKDACFVGSWQLGDG